MVEFLATFSQLRAHNANSFFSNRRVYVSAIATVVGNVVGVRLVDFDIEHIATVDTELHDG
jgi:hypothetical protein